MSDNGPATQEIYRGKWAAEIRRLADALMQALEDEADEEATSARTMLEGSASADLYKRIEDAKQAARDAGATIVVRALERKTWREVKAAHPPRAEGPEVDAEVARIDRNNGVNMDDVEDDLVYKALVTPAFTSRAAFDEWASAVTPGEWEGVVIAAWTLTHGVPFDPARLPASQTPSTEQS